MCIKIRFVSVKSQVRGLYAKPRLGTHSTHCQYRQLDLAWLPSSQPTTPNACAQYLSQLLNSKVRQCHDDHEVIYGNGWIFRMQITCTCTMCFCFSVECPVLSSPSNGTKSGSEVTHLSVVTFSCNTGYTLGGSDSRTCRADGSWSGNTTSCTSKNTSLQPK